MKPVFSKSHAEIIQSVWTELGREGRRELLKSIEQGLRSTGDGEPKFHEVVQASWCLGFHACMSMMEEGQLIKAGPVNVGEN